MPTRRDHIMGLLALGPFTVTDLAAKAGCTETEARNTLARMQTRCLARPVENTRPKQYRLTALGTEEIALMATKPAPKVITGLQAAAPREPAAWRSAR